VPDLDDAAFEDVAEGSTRPWLPPGGYLARWEGRELARYRYGERLVFWWAVYLVPEMGETVRIPGYYGVQRDNAQRFVFGAGHHYRLDWTTANAGQPPVPANKLPLSVFAGRLFLVEIVTVGRTRQRALPETAHWSKIARIVRPVDPGEYIERYPVQLTDNTNEK
jgi:hypothetical protein